MGGRVRALAAAAAVTLGLLAVPAGAAEADGSCDVAVARAGEPATWTGLLHGYVTADAGDEVAITCVLRVDGAEAARTAEGRGTGAAAAAGPVGHPAGDGDVLEVCAVVTVAGATTEECRPRYPLPWGPALPVLELLDATLAPLYEVGPGPIDPWYDPVVCPVLAGAAGTYGPVVVNAQGDVFVDGEPVYDCPPYDH